MSENKTNRIAILREIWHFNPVLIEKKPWLEEEKFLECLEIV